MMHTPNQERLNFIKQKYGYSPAAAHPQRVEPQKIEQTRFRENKENEMNRELEDRIMQVRRDTQTKRQMRDREPTREKDKVVIEILATKERQLKEKEKDKENRMTIRQELMAMKTPKKQTFSPQLQTQDRYDLEASFGLNRSPPFLKEITTTPNQLPPPPLKQSYVQSYQKTYDLLQNYRKRIRSNYQSQQEQQKLNLKDSSAAKSTLTSSSAVKAQPHPSSYSTKTDWSGSRGLAGSRGLSGSRGNPSVLTGSRQVRCSPLQGIETSSVNIQAQLSNIDRIQQKIQSVLNTRICK